MSHAKLPAEWVLHAIQAIDRNVEETQRDPFSYQQRERLRSLERLTKASVECGGELFVDTEDFDLISNHFGKPLSR